VRVLIPPRRRTAPSSKSPWSHLSRQDHVAGHQIIEIVALSGILQPAALRLQFLGLIANTNRACICPPTQRSAAAASTPSLPP